MYKYYAAQGFYGGGVPCIGWASFFEFVNNSRVVDGKLLKTSDVDLKFIATNSMSKFRKSAMNPEKALIRY